MYNMRDEALNLQDVHARDRTQQYIQRGTCTIITTLHKKTVYIAQQAV